MILLYIFSIKLYDKYKHKFYISKVLAKGDFLYQIQDKYFFILKIIG